MQHQRRTFRQLQRERQRTWTRVGPSRLVSAAAPRQTSPLPCLARAFATTSSMLSALLLLLQLLCACGICCCSVGERCARSLAADTPTLLLSSSPARFGCSARIRCAGWKWMCLAWWWEWPASAPSSHALPSPCDSCLSCLSCLTYYRLSALPESVSFLFSHIIRTLTATTDMLLPAATANIVAPSATFSTSATATSHMLPSSTPASPSRCW